MSEQETMRLVAEVVDKYSGPLKKMMDQLKQVGASAKDVHEKGAKQTYDHEKAYKKLTDQITAFKTKGIDPLIPALGAMGITTLSVSAAVAALATTLKDAGARWGAFNDAIQRSGTSANYVGGMARAFELLGMSGEKAAEGVASMGQMLDRLKRHSPQEMNELTGLFQNMLPVIEDTLRGAKSRAEEITRLTELIVNPRIPIDQRRMLAQRFGLDPELASRTAREVGEAINRGLRQEALHPQNIEQMKALQKAFADLGEAITNFRNDTVTSFGPAGVAVVEGFADALGKINESLKDDLRTIREMRDVWEWITGHAPQSTDDAKKRLQEPFGKFGLGGGDRDKQKEAVRQGTKEGLTDFFNQWTEAQKLGAGMQPIAYHPGGGDGGGGGGGRWGSRDYPLINRDTTNGIRGSMSGTALGGGGAGGGGGGINSEGDFDRTFAGTALEGHWSDVVAAAKANGVEPGLMAAIMAHETGRGHFLGGNNVAGLMSGNSKQRFGSITEGINAAGRVIGRNWSRAGGDLHKMAGIYAPVGAANDPRGLNSGWESGVRGFMGGGGGSSPAAVIWHHTGGGNTPDDIRRTLARRGLGVEYIMDKNGNVVAGGGNMRSHMLPGWGKFGAGLSNRNTIGVEVIASDNKHVSQKQIDAAVRWQQEHYPNTPVFGHGQVNPGHKEADEGMAEVNAINAARAHGQALRDAINSGRHDRSPSDTELLQLHREHQSSAGGIKNSLGVTIDMNGLPQGSRVRHAADGPIFRHVTLNRGRAMPDENS